MGGDLMSDNMKLWDAVCLTDPAHTKTVNQRGGFTAIGANYQIKMATEQFGPIGIGWGYDCGEPIFSGTLIIVPVTLWHGERANKFGPELGCEAMTTQGRDGKDRIDTDAPKKATTDALTKLLSRLGFNADVFLGMFDDNKYVQQRQQEVAKENRQQATDAEVKAASAAIEGKADAGMLKAYYLGLPKHVAADSRVIEAKDKRKKELA